MFTRLALLCISTSLVWLVACTSAPEMPPTIISASTPTLSATMPTATATFMPTPEPPPPTFTPIPPEAWQIVFYGMPCSGAVAMCDIDMEGKSAFYSVMNSGTELMLLSQATSNVPTTLPVSFSPNGARFVFRDNLDLVVVNIDQSEVIRFTGILSENTQLFEFLSEDCLVLYTNDLNNPVNQVVVDRMCIGDAKPQTLAQVEFPSQANSQGDYFRSYRLSPQGDKLLAYSQGFSGGEISLYMKLLGNDDTPQLLFHSPMRSCGHYQYQGIAPFRWNPSGESVDLLWTNFCDGQPENVFYQIDWQGKNLLTVANISGSMFIRVGDWSPDGREFAFQYQPVLENSLSPIDGVSAGLYLLNLETGEWKRLVSDLSVDYVVARSNSAR